MCLSDFISFLISRVLGTNTEKQPENFFFHKWFEIISVWDFKTLEVIMKWVTYFWCCASFLEMYFKINFEDSQYKSCFNKRFFFLCFHHTGIYSVRFKQSRLTSPWQVNEFSVHWRQLVLNFSLKQISFKQKKTQTPYNNVFNIYPQFSNFGICHILFFFLSPLWVHCPGNTAIPRWCMEWMEQAPIPIPAPKPHVIYSPQVESSGWGLYQILNW